MNKTRKHYLIELDWLLQCIQNRTTDESTFPSSSKLPPAPSPSGDDSYSRFILNHELNDSERLVLAIAMAPHLQPALLDLLRLEGNRAHVWCSSRSQLVLPTIETALFLIAGENIPERVTANDIFSARHLFYQESVLELGEPEPGFPLHSGYLGISKGFRDLFVHERFERPRFSQEFPAHLLETQLEWSDLLVNATTLQKLEEVKSFLKFESRMRLDLGLGRHMREGYRVLFYGPSGTGKSLAATLIGKMLNREVYRVDLSSVVSKYIGETSKNLNQLFNTAEGKHWILFFDEGDALFGQRQESGQGGGQNSHYANQDTAYLLQRIENYRGLIIVASNFKQNIDEAFSRRFQTLVKFDLPDLETSLQVWQTNLPADMPVTPAPDFSLLARQHNLSQAAIIKVIQRSTLQALMQSHSTIPRSILERCILDESLNFKTLRP